jgi:acyl carrier protein
MNTKDRVASAFKDALDLDEGTDLSKLKYQEYPSWNSIGHMTLIAALETEFDTMLETDDILEMSSFDKAVEIMSRHTND